MPNYGTSFCMAHKEDRPKLVELLIKVVHPCRFDSGTPWTITPVDFALTKDTPFSREVSRRFPKVEWRRLHRSTGPACLVAKIHTDAGLVITWRNGWDMSQYNFAVWFNGQFHFRANYKDACELAEILTSPEKDLPLFIHCTNEKNRDYVLNHLTDGYKLCLNLTSSPQSSSTDATTFMMKDSKSSETAKSPGSL